MAAWTPRCGCRRATAKPTHQTNAAARGRRRWAAASKPGRASCEPRSWTPREQTAVAPAASEASPGKKAKKRKKASDVEAAAAAPGEAAPVEEPTGKKKKKKRNL